VLGPDEPPDTIAAIEELFRIRAEHQTLWAARAWYWRQVLGFALRWPRIWGGRPTSAVADLRFAARGLRKAPGFTVPAVATLGLGLGAAAITFGVVDEVLLSPLPYDEPDRVVWLWETPRGRPGEEGPVSPINLSDWWQQNDVFDAIGGEFTRHINLTEGDRPERVEAGYVTSSVFDALGIEPTLGRTFTMEEQAQHQPLAILSYGLWQRRFAGDPDVLGREVHLEGAYRDETPYTVIGVMPRGFRFAPLEHKDLWLPIRVGYFSSNTRSDRFLRVVARLRAGITLEEARANMETIYNTLAQEHEENRDRAILIKSMREAELGQIDRSVAALFGAVLFLLLISCFNVANLSLTRGSGRAYELGIRAALGARRSRLVRLLVLESVLLAAMGGAVAVGLVFLTPDIVNAVVRSWLGEWADLSPDLRVVGFAGLLALMAAAISAIVPSMRYSSIDLASTLSAGTAGGGRAHRAGRRFRDAIVVTEVALALVLLSGAGLFLRSYVRLTAVESGVDADNVMVLGISTSLQRFPLAEDVARYAHEVVDQVASLPGVESAAISPRVPFFGGGWNRWLWPADRPAPAGRDEVPSERYVIVTPDYFHALGIPVLQGRGFTDTDDMAGQPVVVVSQALAERTFPGEAPIGKQILIGGLPAPLSQDPPPARTIVGVVGDVRLDGLDRPAIETVYAPYAQETHRHSHARFLYLMVRPRSDDRHLPGTVIRDRVWSVDATQPIPLITTVQTQLRDRLGRRRFNLVLFAVFAGLAVLLAAVGLYGVQAYSVKMRTAEIGIRIALGAGGNQVGRMIVGRALGLAGLGVVLGLGAALVLSRFLTSLLYEVSPTDPATLGGLSLFLMAVALLSAYLPARRAARLDPTAALRSE
jgi:putative ABC transport system permease protein